MKKLILAIMVVCMLPLQALAECKWETGITKLSNGNYEYTKECHVKVGETVRDLNISLGQNLKLTEALSFKDLALTKANERADLWMNTSYKLEARIETMDSIYQRNKWLYFGLGILVASAAVYGAGQLNNR